MPVPAQGKFKSLPTHHVVVDDPDGTYWEGAIVAVEVARALRSRRVTTLPIDPKLVGRSAVGGYFRRAWGSGWPIDTPQPKRACPVVLYVQQDDCTAIHWAARLTADHQVLDSIRAGKRPTGALMLAADTQPGAYSGGFSGGPNNKVEGNKLPAPDVDDGWTVYGEGLITPPGDGMVPLSLWGHLQGMRVIWLAVSQSR